MFLTLLGATWLLKLEGHVKMDLLVNQLNPRTQALLNIITSILGAIICLVIAWYGTEVTWSQFQKGITYPTVLEPPVFIILSVIPIGYFLLFIQFLRRTYSFLRKLSA